MNRLHLDGCFYDPEFGETEFASKTQYSRPEGPYIVELQDGRLVKGDIVWSCIDGECFFAQGEAMPRQMNEVSVLSRVVA